MDGRGSSCCISCPPVGCLLNQVRKRDLYERATSASSCQPSLLSNPRFLASASRKQFVNRVAIAFFVLQFWRRTCPCESHGHRGYRPDQEIQAFGPAVSMEGEAEASLPDRSRQRTPSRKLPGKKAVFASAACHPKVSFPWISGPLASAGASVFPLPSPSL